MDGISDEAWEHRVKQLKRELIREHRTIFQPKHTQRDTTA